MIASCPVCREAKGHRTSFLKKAKSKKATKLGEVVLVDLCKMSCRCVGGAQHMLVFVDQYSKFMAAFPLANKSLAHSKIPDFVTLCKNTLNVNIATIHSDNEFKSNALDAFCREQGIRQEFTSACTPQLNGEVERANRTLVEANRAMLLGGRMTEGF